MDVDRGEIVLPPAPQPPADWCGEWGCNCRYETMPERRHQAAHFGRNQPCDSDCSRSGIDQTDLDDSEKVWRCDGCGETGTSAALDAAHVGRNQR